MRRARAAPAPGRPPGATAGKVRALPLPGEDADVGSLLPQMKRVRLTPSVGSVPTGGSDPVATLRLRREAEEAAAGAHPLFRMRIQPEALRAGVSVGGCLSEGAGDLRLELRFPPQYPFRPPEVLQVSPEARLPQLRYAGRALLLPCLAEGRWSFAMALQSSSHSSDSWKLKVGSFRPQIHCSTFSPVSFFIYYRPYAVQ